MVERVALGRGWRWSVGRRRRRARPDSSLPPASDVTRGPRACRPPLTDWPSSQTIARPSPESSASTGISIFIDSRITTRVALLDGLADLALDLPHRPGDVGLNIRQLFLLVAGCGTILRPVILAIDQGTTGTTCLVFDERGGVAGRGYREFEQHFPRPGWVEHDAAEIWDVTAAVAEEALDDAGIAGRDLAGIGITNQRETVVVWDRDTGEPLHRAIVWQDRRTAAPLRRAQASRATSRASRERTGLVLDPYFSGTKIEWLIKRRATSTRRGVRDDRLLAALQAHRRATRPTTRTRRGRCCSTSTTCRWDDGAVRAARRAAGVARRAGPERRGRTARPSVFGGSVPVAGIAGDQQAALYGQACHERRARQEHLRHRQLRARERGQRAARGRRRAC